MIIRLDHCPSIYTRLSPRNTRLSPRQLLELLEDEGRCAVVDAVVEVKDLLEAGLGGLVLTGHTVRAGVQLVLGQVELGQDVSIL